MNLLANTEKKLLPRELDKPGESVEESLRQVMAELEQRARALAAINRIAMIINQSLKLNEILQALCRELPQIFPVRNAGIGLLSDDKKSLEIVAFHSVVPAEKSAMGLILPIELNSHTQQVIDARHTLVIQYAQTVLRTQSIAGVSRQRVTKAIMVVPLLTRGDAIGTIGLPAKDPTYVFTKEEIELAETIASHIAATVDNSRLHAQVTSALGAAEQDLEIGRQIQSGFFPEQLPEIPGWELAVHFEAARQVSGDFYDVFQLENSPLTAFIIADVCDKGVGAALFMVLTRSLLRAFSAMQSPAEEIAARLQNAIQWTSNYIAETHGRSNMFATVFSAILDPASNILYYVNAGHEPPVILDSAGNLRNRLNPTGPAAGLFPDMDFLVERIELQEGDILFGYTDGVIDAQSPEGLSFNEERLLSNIAAPWTSIFSMVFELHIELHRHMGGRKQYDDITFLSLRRIPSGATTRHAICRPAQLRYLPEIRDFVAAAGNRYDLSPDDIFALKLAADEVCTNIIEHGYPAGEPGLVSIFLDLDGDTARLTISDDGVNYPPEQAAQPDLDADWQARPVGGLGIYFVKKLMDNISYRRIDQGFNQMVLEKKIERRT